ncbi:HbrB protein [Rhizoctonia solani]|uniref:HbrB protein n=1 Tax=Rhizoctonia solani TaxID=456999 RepID=A0A8H7IDN7_9AGAM|nr:HbrB protein [Rhizoctonia solani]
MPRPYPTPGPRRHCPLAARTTHVQSPLCRFFDSERRRSNSDGTAPTPRPPPRPLAVHVPSPVQENTTGAGGSISSSSDQRIRPTPPPQRSGTSSTGTSSLFVAHSIGMSRSQGGTPRDPASGQGAYDPKLLVREMDRLGAVPSANTSTLSLPLSSQPLSSIAGGGSMLNSTTSDTAPYQELHVHVLPLFNSENLRLPIEELNTLVKQHIQAELANMGMITLNAKLLGLEEETLLTRVVQIWGFFWDQVLPYLEGVFLPLQTEKILQNLARNPKTVRPGSPGSPVHDLPGVAPLVGCTTIDVRNVVLQSFRDSIICPIWQKLYDQLVAMGKDPEASASLGDRSARLQQMLLVLSSASSRSILLSQSSQISPMNPGEEGVTHLLRAILRVRALSNSGGAQPHQRFAPPPALGFGGPSADVFAPSRDEIETKDRQKERQFLDSLKSPVPQNEVGAGLQIVKNQRQER